MSSPRPITTLLLGACLMAVAPAVAKQPAPSPALELPDVSLDRFDPAVREQLTEARQAVDAALAEGLGSAALAATLGHLGQLYLAYDLLDPALAALEAALARQETSARWVYLIGYAQQRQGAAAAALDRFDETLELEPHYAAAHLRSGQLYLARGALDEAKSSFEAALDSDASCVASRYGLGEVARRQGRFEEAVALFEGALDAYPDAAQLHYGLGQTLRQMGRRDEALAHLEKAQFQQVSLGAWWGCPDPYVAELSTLTSGAAIHLARGAQAGFRGDHELELAEYQKAVEANPDDEVARKSLGAALYRRDDLEGAAENYSAALEIKPEDASFHYALGQIRLRQGQKEEALALFQRAVELNPRLIEAHLKLAAAYQEAGLFDVALSHYDRVLEVDPVHVQAKVQRAFSLLRLGRGPEAVAALGQLLDEHPPQDPAERIRLATLVLSLGDVERAVEHALDVLDLEAPNSVHAQAHLIIAQSLMRLGKTDEAIQSFEKAVETDPEFELAKKALEQARKLAAER